MSRKTNQNTHWRKPTKPKKPQMYKNKSNPARCPVNSYLTRRAHRPAEMLANESPLYLAINIEVPKSEGQQWRKRHSSQT